MGDQSNIKRQPQKKNSDDHRIFSMVYTPFFKSVIKKTQKVHQTNDCSPKQKSQIRLSKKTKAENRGAV